MTEKTKNRKPPWLRVRLPGGESYSKVRSIISGHRLHTVCEEALCPNLGECWGAGTATFLILGDTCTRGCRFCNVSRHPNPGAPDATEPERVAAASGEMAIRYAVITSVTRDDLADNGSGIYGQTVRALKRLSPPPLVELLVPDFNEPALKTVLDAGPDVLAHNIEVVERLTPALRHDGFTYRRSLDVLANAKTIRPAVVTKSSILLGLGETDDEVKQAMRDLRDAGVDILVLGQYLRPTRQNIEVTEYITPEAFDTWRVRGEDLGFAFVAASPLARTSYKAREAYEAARSNI
jgi:lipoic acid synthetase